MTFCQMFGRRRAPSERSSLLMFHIDRPIARISSSLVLYRVPRSGSFGEEIVLAGLISGEYGECSRIPHAQRRKMSVTAVVWLLAFSWTLMRFCTSAGNRRRFSDEWIGPPDDVTTSGYLRFNHQLVSYTIVAHWITSTRACVYDLACGGNSSDKFGRSRVLKGYCARASSWANSSKICE